MKNNINGGDAFIFSFPFWFLCKKANAFQTEEFKYQDTSLRIYPPFRSGKPNFTPMPQIDPLKIPFLDGQSPDISPNFKILNISVIPVLPEIDGGDANLTLMFGEEWEAELPEVMPMDSLRVDVLHNGKELKNSAASNFIKEFLEHLRHKSKQWWIDRSVDALLGSHRSSFAITTEGAPLDMPYGLSQGRAPYGFERPITNNIWAECISLSKKSNLINEEDLLISDAYFFNATNDFRRAIIDAATGAEIAKDNTFENIWKQKNKGKKYHRGKVLSGYELPVHLNKNLKDLTGKSFSDTHPNEAFLIKRLWLLRGKVAHGLPLTFSSSKGIVKLDSTKLAEMIGAVERLINWLKTL